MILFMTGLNPVSGDADNDGEDDGGDGGYWCGACGSLSEQHPHPEHLEFKERCLPLLKWGFRSFLFSSFNSCFNMLDCCLSLGKVLGQKSKCKCPSFVSK